VDGGRQGEKRRDGAARRRSRGHGPARLDGPRERATVAGKVMKSGKTAGHGNGRLCVPNRTASEARRPEAGSRAGGVSRAERGNDGSPKGRDAAGGSMRYAHDSATGHLPGGRGRPGCHRIKRQQPGAAKRSVNPLRLASATSSSSQWPTAWQPSKRFSFPHRKNMRKYIYSIQ
jgi:hypothetical protein